MQDEIVKLFKQTWPKITSGKIKPVPQKEENVLYYPKKAIEKLDKLELNKYMKTSDVINILRTRSFGDTGYAYYMQNGKKVYVNIRLAPKPNFPPSKKKSFLKLKTLPSV